MLELQDIGIGFGSNYLFKNVNWRINDGNRVGLIGVNGSGKTTLLRIIQGDISPDNGKVIKSKRDKIGYLPQEGVAFRENSLYNEMIFVFNPIIAILKEKDKLTKELAKVASNSKRGKEILYRYGELEEKVEVNDGYNIENKVEKVLTGLGFKEEDWHKPTHIFSGGWELRIALGKLLLQEPDVLLLDEPTNFLDIKSIVWVENYLKNFQGTIILVSHDRCFMDKIVRKIAEIEFGKLLHYNTNYAGHTVEKEKRRETILKAYKDQQGEIKKIKTFVDKFRANASKARLVKSREKILEKMEIIRVPPKPKKVKFNFSPTPHSGHKVLELKNIAKSYNGKKVFESVNLSIEKGERIAIIGVNGAGKSTLLKIMTGLLEPDNGERKLGINVHIGYFAQRSLEVLNLENSLLAEIEDAASNETETRIRTLLATFLFTKDDIFKKVKVLSGGEKTRLALARILIKPINLLILDEPTNHLDLQGRQVLEQALELYNGTLILTTHDRYMIDRLCNKVIEVANREVKVYFGNYSYYSMRKAENREESEKKKQKEIPGIERLIEKKEQRVSKLKKLFLDPDIYSGSEKVNSLTVEYKRLSKEIDRLYKEWEDSQSLI